MEGERGRSLVGGGKSLMVPYGSHFEGGCMSVRRCSCGGGGGLISLTQYHFDCVPGYTTIVFKSIIQYGFMPGKKNVLRLISMTERTRQVNSTMWMCSTVCFPRVELQEHL